MNNKNNAGNNGGTMCFDFVEPPREIAKIRVIGIGGAGGNAINRMIEARLTGVEFIAMNTDLQALEMNKAPIKIQLGKSLTRGLGAGGIPEIGRRAVEENKDAVIEVLSDSDMVFIACGMGGGTGTGAAPVVAEIARDIEALTVGIITKPFMFEGLKRGQRAELGIRDLKENVDTLITVPNQKLLTLVPKNTPLDQAFRVADEILLNATRGISDVINIHGMVNLDFADVKTVMSQMGDALMGSGQAAGDTRGKDAAEMAITSPMIEDVTIKGAQGVLVNITGGKDLNLNDVNEAMSIVHEAAGVDANIICGAVIDNSMQDEVGVMVIATGFNKNNSNHNKTSGVRRISRTTLGSKPDEDIHDDSENNSLEEVLGKVFGNDGVMSMAGSNPGNGNGNGNSEMSKLDVPAYLRKYGER